MRHRGRPRGSKNRTGTLSQRARDAISRTRSARAEIDARIADLEPDVHGLEVAVDNAKRKRRPTRLNV